jgi:hypothetical protein
MPVTLWTYQGRPPSLATITAELDLRPTQFHYLVATTAQQRARNSERIEPAEQGERGECSLVFHQAVRHWLDDLGRPVMTRAEERILIYRSAAAAVVHLPIEERDLAEQQVRQDTALWAEALADLSARGIDLTQETPSDDAREVLGELASPALAPVLRALQTALAEGVREGAGPPFEAAAHELLSGGWAPKVDQIVMEGFTFLTALQQQLIAAAAAQDVSVHLIFPYLPDHAAGFAIFQRTYEQWWPTEGVPASLSEPTPPESSLAHLQARLFNDLEEGPQQAPTHYQSSEDESTTIGVYRHRDEELRALLTKLVSYRNRSDAERPRSIFIVAPDPEQTQILLQEAADALGYRDIRLGVPPRLLLLTPLGRFVLTLYDAWDVVRGALSLDADQFGELLASGWLGASVKRSAPTYELIRYQWFERTSSEDDWRASLDSLLARVQQPESFGPVERQPARSVRPEHIEAWNRALDTVTALCRRLFGAGPLSIDDHIKQLVEALREEAPPDLRAVERELIERIQQALLQASQVGTLAVTAEEFGTSLVGLARAQAQFDEDAPYEVGDEGKGDEGPRIWIVGFEGIDGAEADVVFLQSVDHKRVPQPMAEPWPLYDLDLDEHIERRRYLFLAAVRAARSRLHLSYAELDHEGRNRASPYLIDVYNAIDWVGAIEEPQPAIDSRSIDELELSPDEEPTTPFTCDSYSIHELAHHTICPRRFLLERLDHAASRYREQFHLRLLAEAIWADLAYRRLENTGPLQSQSDATDKIGGALDATLAEAQALLPGLRPLDWYAARESVESSAHWSVENEWEKLDSFGGTFRPADSAEYVVEIESRTVSVDASLRHRLQTGRIARPVFADVLGEQWLRYGFKPTAACGTSDAMDDVGQHHLHRFLYCAVQEWRGFVKAAFVKRHSDASYAPATVAYGQAAKDVTALIRIVEAGHFPKHPAEGNEACLYCPVQSRCLGKTT